MSALSFKNNLPRPQSGIPATQTYTHGLPDAVFSRHHLAKHVCDLLLLVNVSLLGHPFGKPFRMAHTRDGIVHLSHTPIVSAMQRAKRVARRSHLLHGRGNGNDFLNGFPQTINVVVPAVTAPRNSAPSTLTCCRFALHTSPKPIGYRSRSETDP